LKIYNFPIYFSHFLEAVLLEYFKDNQALIYIHKSQFYHRYIDKVRKQFPEAKFIFIDRDPRAIFNSQQRSSDSTTKKPMETNVELFVRAYKRNYEIIRKFIDDDFFHIVVYEKLLQDEDNEIKKILKFLNVSGDKNLKDNYYERIPINQKYLHTNINTDTNITNRINGWQSELNMDKVYFLQLTLKSILNEKGYILKKIPFYLVENKKKLIFDVIKYFRHTCIPIFIKRHFPSIHKNFSGYNY